MTEITPWWRKFGQPIQSYFLFICKTGKNIIATDLEIQNNSPQGNIFKFPLFGENLFFDRNYST